MEELNHLTSQAEEAHTNRSCMSCVASLDLSHRISGRCNFGETKSTVSNSQNPCDTRISDRSANQKLVGVLSWAE